jgi:hypothetical protein
MAAAVGPYEPIAPIQNRGSGTVALRLLNGIGSEKMVPAGALSTPASTVNPSEDLTHTIAPFAAVDQAQPGAVASERQRRSRCRTRRHAEGRGDQRVDSQRRHSGCERL